MIIGMIYLHIIESSIPYGALDGIVWIGIDAIETIEHKRRIDIAKSLSTCIAQIRLGESVFQSGKHMVNILHTLAQLQFTESKQVILYVFHKEMLRIEPHVPHSLKISKQGVGTMVHTMSVNPKKTTLVAVISLGMLVSHGSAAVIAHQAIHQLPNSL